MTTDISRNNEDMALWRYGVIAQLLHRTDDSPSLNRELRALSMRTFFTPTGQEKQLSVDTLRLWLYRYKAQGITGLSNKVRKDFGGTRIPDEIKDALIILRKEHPLFTIKRMLIELQKQKLWNGSVPSRAAIYRFTSAQNLNRSDVPPPEAIRSFEYPFFGDLWSADFLHGPLVKDGVHQRKTYLHAIIDDATRYVVAAEFHLAENTESLLSDMMKAIMRFGVPRRFYTDNGAAFRSNHLRMVAAKMKIALPHTPPYKPRGRGKIERFFRTVRDGFLTGRPKTTLRVLNDDLMQWIDQYHKAIHSKLNMSPLNRKLDDQGPPLPRIDPIVNINDLFRMNITKKVNADGCVHLFGNRYEVKDSYPGEVIEIYYVPWNKEHILTGPDRLPAKLLDTHSNAKRFDKPIRGIRKSTTNL